MRKLITTFCLSFTVLLGSIGSSSALPPCDSSSSYWNNCFGNITYPSGNKYVGEWRNNKKHGQGTQTWGSGSKWAGHKYVGQFKNNQMHGQGTYTYSNGDKYVGDYKNGKTHGQGTITWSEGSKWAGDKHVGEFKDNKRHGQGTYTYANGSIKEGVWEYGFLKYAQKVTPPAVVRKSPSPSPRRRTDPDKVFSASSGSGFAVSSRGHVITNHHVIYGCQKVKIHHNGKSIPATVVTYDPQNDLALLKGDFQPPTVLPLSNESPELLQDVYVAGYPFGQRISTGVKVTKGIISSLTGAKNNFANIQIDAALQPGNSGGPILDDRGNVVGVAVAKMDVKESLKRFGVIPENTNFGIKTSLVRSILESSNVSAPKPNNAPISKSILGKMISGGTYYLSCWMTMAQIEKIKSQKVIFQILK